MGYAFISYSTKDRSSADSMREILKNKNIDSWMAPYDLPQKKERFSILRNALRLSFIHCN